MARHRQESSNEYFDLTRYPLPHVVGNVAQPAAQPRGNGVQYRDFDFSDCSTGFGNAEVPCAPFAVSSPGVFTSDCDSSWDPFESQFTPQYLQNPSTAAMDSDHQNIHTSHVPYIHSPVHTTQASGVAHDDNDNDNEEDSDGDKMSYSPSIASPTSMSGKSSTGSDHRGGPNESQQDFNPDHKSQRPNEKLSRKTRRHLTSSIPETSTAYKLRGVSTSPRMETSCGSKAENTPQSRVSHNMVEKMYRTRLNTQFSNLLDAIPTEVAVQRFDGYVGTGGGRGRVSKGDVLALAKGYIQALEGEKRSLEQEKEENQATISRLGDALLKSRSGHFG
ncbi:hypothetical protein L207DRAFT_570963 [Hyaloscypha variabilis F]|uniref:BHLH domain-containing protein n=1 Tax=Hyaloscypha variabilis (strain UAMH 11265 / GT02V1 / F) TaxID=1149755 RepID=A0A2J6R772_HYAVF|nr:hypothetical protein L207DRAFT_570963 [Hyaloscypha variabilis F]